MFQDPEMVSLVSHQAASTKSRADELESFDVGTVWERRLIVDWVYSVPNRYANGRIKLYQTKHQHPVPVSPLTWTKEGSWALANRFTIARSKSGSTGPMTAPAFRNRCMISSPTKIPPDSENVGSRNRPRRPKMLSMPFKPPSSRLFGGC